MPALSSSSTWRTHPQTVSTYLYILNPDVVLARRVNQTAFTYPVVELTYDDPDGGAGVYTDVEVGQTLQVLSSAGAHKGFARVKTITDTTLGIAPVSRGDLAFANNDQLRVLDDFRLWSKIPHINSLGIQFKDYDRVFLAVSAQPPVANASPWYAGLIDPDTELVTVALDATGSFAVAEGASLASYLWDVKDGTITTGTDSDPQITATFPAGYRWVSLTVTDSSGNSHTARTLVVAATESTALQAVVTQLNGSLENGWAAGFQVLEADVSQYPLGTPVIFWTEEKYGSTAGSLNGYAGREHVKFCGWLTDDTALIQPYSSDWTIAAQNAYGILQGLPGFSQTTERSASPTSWYHVADLTWWRHVHYLMLWHSTLLDVCDVERPAFFASYDVLRLDADAGTLTDQYRFIAEAIAGRFTVDHLNRVYWRRNPHLMSSSDRASLTTIVTLQDTDWTDRLDIPTRHRPQANVIFGAAVIASASAAAACKAAAPGTSPGQGARQDSVDRWLVTSQSDLNERLGRYYALQNIDEPRLPIQILNGGLIADPAWQEWVKLTTSAANTRGKSYTDQKFVLVSVSVRYDAESGTSLEAWELEKAAPDTVASAITVVLPRDEPPEDEDYIPDDGGYEEQPPPPYDYLPDDDFIPDDVVTPPEGDTIRRAIGWSNPLRITAQAQNDSPVWSELFAPDGENVLSVQESAASTYPPDAPLEVWALSDAGLYFTEDALAESPVFELKQSIADGLLLRSPGANKILVHASEAATNGTWSKTFDFTELTALTPWHVFSVNEEPYSRLTLLNGTWGVLNETFGVDATVGQTDAGFAKRIDLVFPCEAFTLMGFSALFDFEGGINDPLVRLRYNQTQVLEEDTDPPTANDQTMTWNGTQADVNEISFTAQTSFNSESEILADSGSARLKSITVEGTGFNPFEDQKIVVYSANDGDSISTSTFGQRGTEAAFDADDFGLGVVIAASEARLFSSTGYGDDSFDVIRLIPFREPINGVRPTVIRIPYRKLATQALNNDKNSLQFIYGVNSAIENPDEDDREETLWGVNFDAETRDSLVISNMTPVIDETVYYVVGANALETAGANTQIILAFCKPVGGGATKLLRTTNGGTTWAIVNDFDGDFVRWIPGSTTEAWVSGADGIGYTANRGTTIADRTGDFSGTLLGAYGFDD